MSRRRLAFCLFDGRRKQKKSRKYSCENAAWCNVKPPGLLPECPVQRRHDRRACSGGVQAPHADLRCSVGRPNWAIGETSSTADSVTTCVRIFKRLASTSWHLYSGRFKCGRPFIPYICSGCVSNSQ